MAPPYNHVARDGDKEFQDAAFQQPRDDFSENRGGVAEIEVEQDAPGKPQPPQRMRIQRIAK